MSTTSITKHDHGDGKYSETHRTEYPRGTVVEKEIDTTDHTLIGGDKFISKTTTDPDGNTTTERRK